MPTTTNRALRYPAGNEAPNVPLDFSELGADLDNVANIYFGTFATRGNPVAGAGHAQGHRGSLYVATDTAQVFISTGSAWIDLGAGPPVPVGGAIEYAGAGDPADNRWLLEDGRSMNSVADTTLAALFATIGTTWGGTGASAFNLPDSRGRVTVGTDNMGTSAGAANRIPNNPRGLASMGGAERHTHTGATPDHLHGAGSLFTGNHQHTYVSPVGINSGLPDLMDVRPWSGVGGQDQASHAGFVIPGNTRGWRLPIGALAGYDLMEVHRLYTDVTGNIGIGGSTGASDRSLAFTTDLGGSMQPYIVKNKLIRVR
jgi:microcystin-dependent protein